MSGLTLLLPHGHEGQGPEHTSSRLERFLQMCAEDNIQVVNCTSPANYFHTLRRQLHRNFRKPLIIMTPKSTLRHKNNVSGKDYFINESTFHRVLRNEITKEKEKKINRIIICSGKLYFELQDHIEELQKEDVFILRLEQIYPFPYDVFSKELKRFSNCEIIWCQEEPKNMGAYGFVKRRIESVMKNINMKQEKLLYVGRRAAASPATGVFDRHLANQKNILRLAIEAEKQEILDMWSGVSLVKYQLPIE